MEKKMDAKKLADQLVDIDALIARQNTIQYAVGIIAELKETVTHRMEKYTRQYQVVAVEPKQAVNRNGELLYSVDEYWKNFTEAELAEKGLTPESDSVHPHHDNIYDYVDVDAEELDDDSKRRYNACKMVLDMLEAL